MNYAVEVKNLTVRYGKVEALSDVNMEVAQGEYLGIIGPNGGGKTTLLKAILGLIKPDLGNVTKACGKGSVGYVPQFAYVDKNFPINVLETVLSGKLDRRFIPFFHYTKNDKDEAFSILDTVGLKGFENRQVSELSGGEFQKMLIARALILKPKLLLLDEPTASVDSASREHIFSLLSQLNKDMTIILVTHDLLAVSSEVKSLACMNHSLIYHGEPELTETVVKHLYGCPVDLIAHGVPHRVLKEHEGEDKC